MPKAKNILLIIFTVLLIFVFTVLVSSIVNHPHVKNADIYPIFDYLDAQKETHRRAGLLTMDIYSRYQNSPEDIKVLLNYIERLHEEAIVLGNSDSNRLAKITACADDPESLRWISERLIWVMQPMEEVSDRDAKIVILIMSMEIEYLHGSLRLLAGDKIEEVTAKITDFKKKFQK